VPRLLSSVACHYEVEWETEYACPVDSLVSHGCQLNIDEHGIHVDLSPLASGYCKLTHDAFVFHGINSVSVGWATGMASKV